MKMIDNKQLKEWISKNSTMKTFIYFLAWQGNTDKGSREERDMYYKTLNHLVAGYHSYLIEKEEELTNLIGRFIVVPILPPRMLEVEKEKGDGLRMAYSQEANLREAIMKISDTHKDVPKHSFAITSPSDLISGLSETGRVRDIQGLECLKSLDQEFWAQKGTQYPNLSKEKNIAILKIMFTRNLELQNLLFWISLKSGIIKANSIVRDFNLGKEKDKMNYIIVYNVNGLLPKLDHHDDALNNDEEYDADNPYSKKRKIEQQEDIKPERDLSATLQQAIKEIKDKMEKERERKDHDILLMRKQISNLEDDKRITGSKIAALEASNKTLKEKCETMMAKLGEGTVYTEFMTTTTNDIEEMKKENRKRDKRIYHLKQKILPETVEETVEITPTLQNDPDTIHTKETHMETIAKDDTKGNMDDSEKSDDSEDEEEEDRQSADESQSDDEVKQEPETI